MPPKKRPATAEDRARFIAEVRREQADRQKTYREQALALFPHVCGRCGREFIGKNLRELTVHHKDSNHLNNPTDGSNWELLCLYCHDHEHRNDRKEGHYGEYAGENDGPPPLSHNPFEGLGNLLKPDDESDSK